MNLAGLGTALFATTGAQAAATLAVLALPTLAAQAAAELGAAAHWLGLHVSIVYLHAALSSAFGASALRRLGPARATQVALLACAGGLLLPAIGCLAGAALGAALIGSGYGLTNPAASEVLNRLAPQGRRNVIFAVKQTGVPIGGVLAGILLPALALGLGWRAALTCCAVGTVLVALALSPLRAAWDARRDPAAPFLSASGNSVAALSRNRALRALAVVGAIYAAVQLSFAAYLVTMLVEEFAWGAVAAGAASATAQASGAVGRLGWAALADRAGGRGMTVLALTGICTAAGLLGLLLAGSDWPPDGMLLALLCFVGACSLGWNGVLLAEAARLAPQGNAGRGVGAVLSITFVGVMVGPPLIGLGVSALGSYAAAFGVAALVALIGAAIALSARGQA